MSEQDLERADRAAGLALKCLGVISQCASGLDKTQGGGPPSGDWLRVKMGLGHDEWRACGGPLIASLLFFAWESNFPEWHAETMVDREPHP